MIIESGQDPQNRPDSRNVRDFGRKSTDRVPGPARLAEAERRVAELEGVVLALTAALTRLRMAPGGEAPATSWPMSVEAIARPLVERRNAPARQAWLREINRLT